MKQIILASKNPIKANATLDAFKKMFPGIDYDILQVSVPSGVAHQPMSHAETLQGALQRTANAQQSYPTADFWVGIEGGVQVLESQLGAFAWVVVKTVQLTGKSCTGTFFLPDEVALLINAGKELGEADDLVFQRNNSKQENGAVGLLTGNVINRKQLYEHAVILALIPFKNPTLYMETS